MLHLTVFLSCHIRVLEWICTLQLPEGQKSYGLKQVRYLMLKWLQRESNPQPLTSVCKRTLNNLAKLAERLNWVVRTYLYDAFDCVFLLCLIRVLWMNLHYTGKYSQNSSINWPAWLNGWLFVYKLSDSGFVSLCSHLYCTYRACFDQGVPWNSRN